MHGYDPLSTGIGFLLPTTVVVTGSAIAGRLATRFGLRATLITTLVVGALGATLLGLAMTRNSPYAVLIRAWSP